MTTSENYNTSEFTTKLDINSIHNANFTSKFKMSTLKKQN